MTTHQCSQDIGWPWSERAPPLSVACETAYVAYHRKGDYPDTTGSTSSPLHQ